MSPTGRFANSKPEIQDLRWGRRPYTVAEHTTAMANIDLSQIELRLMSHLTPEELELLRK